MTTHPLHAAPAVLPLPSHDAHFALDGLTVKYAGQTRMRLAITSGMADARIRIDPNASALIAIDYDEDTPPRLRVSSSELRLSWPSSIESWLHTLLSDAYHDVEIVLHPAVEWTLQIRGGLCRFEGDLAAGKLSRLEISGGVGDVRFDLPAPSGPVPIRISGGASDVVLRRPADTGVSLAVGGGISGLRLDDQRFDAIGGGARLASGLLGSAAHYAVEISGGASDLTVVPR